MCRENPPITSIERLLEVLYVEMWGTRKTSAIVRIRGNGKEVEVIENFDDGKGHSNAFTSEYHPLDWSVFEEAFHLRYISGLLRPGYISTSEFGITREGNQVHSARLALEDKKRRENAEAIEIANFIPNGPESD